jgi:hypothetical protein
MSQRSVVNTEIETVGYINLVEKGEKTMKKIIPALTLLFLVSAVSHGQTVLIRPDTAIGYFSADDMKGWVSANGLKLHLSANEFQRYGILVNHLCAPNDNQISYICTGIMIEQVLFKYFNTGIGTVGYINLVQKGENPFGLYTHLGFEYQFTKYFNIVAAYRSDFIFRKQFTMYNAFMLGLGLQL